jgi:hypothetical protein
LANERKHIRGKPVIEQHWRNQSLNAVFYLRVVLARFPGPPR